jgi:hypothetical protein
MNGGIRGQGHVNFSIDPSTDGEGGDGHADFLVDPWSPYALEVELLPGDGGAEICAYDGGRENGHVDFRIVVGADGGVEVDGELLAVCDPAMGCRIVVGWSPEAGTVAVQVVDAGGTLCAAQYLMAGAPDEVLVAAAEIRALSVVQQ